MPDCQCYSLNITCRLNYHRLSMVRDVDDDETSDNEELLRTSSFTTAGARSRENENWKNSRNEEIRYYSRVALLTWKGNKDETPGMPEQQMMDDTAYNVKQLLTNDGINPAHLSDAQFASFQQQNTSIQQKSIQLHHQMRYEIHKQTSLEGDPKAASPRITPGVRIMMRNKVWFTYARREFNE